MAKSTPNMLFVGVVAVVLFFTYAYFIIFLFLFSQF